MRPLLAPLIVLLLSVSACEADAINPSTDGVGDAAPIDTGGSPPLDTSTPGSETTPDPDTGGPAVDSGPAAETAPPTDGGTPASGDCDLNGRWLLSQHTVATALGQKQASHNWFYYEITQDGENATVTKGLHCGYQVNKVSAFGANVSSQKAWPSFLKHNNSNGRKGTFKVSGTSCSFGLAKEYAVRGATVPFYLDPSKPLPGKTNQAMGATPGWEDWEPDTKPGITLTVTGTASGDLYLVQRDWTQYTGTVPFKSVKFMVPITWDTEASVLGSTNSIIETKGTPDGDKNLHYVWWHRLTAGQATGADAAICDAVRTLKGTLVPEADKD